MCFILQQYNSVHHISRYNNFESVYLHTYNKCCFYKDFMVLTKLIASIKLGTMQQCSTIPQYDNCLNINVSSVLKPKIVKKWP